MYSCIHPDIYLPAYLYSYIHLSFLRSLCLPLHKSVFMYFYPRCRAYTFTVS